MPLGLLSKFRRRLSSGKTQQHLKKSQHIQVTNPWHAVGIAPSGSACRPCMKLKQARFLAKEAPSLPLPDCTQPQGCSCVYRHFPDRRAGARRATEKLPPPFNPNPVRTAQDNRRRSTGRRYTDGR